jgi:Zn-dependent protease with chaperone function
VIFIYIQLVLGYLLFLGLVFFPDYPALILIAGFLIHFLGLIFVVLFTDHFKLFPELQVLENWKDQVDFLDKDVIVAVDPTLKNNAYQVPIGFRTSLICITEEMSYADNFDKTRVILAHEHGHIKRHHAIKGVLFLSSMAPTSLFVVIAIAMYIPLYTLLPIPFFVHLLSKVTYQKYCQHQEYEADEYAASIVGAEKIIAMLKQIETKRKKKKNHHPSAVKRIENLIK